MTRERDRSSSPVSKDTANPALTTMYTGGDLEPDTPARQERQPRPIPDHFGRYQVTDRIGQGAFADVFRARDEQLKRDVAIKVPRHSERSAFQAEAQLVANLRHPSIVSVHDFGVEESGDCYLVSELVNGETLLDRMKRGPVPWSEALRIGVQCAEALHFAHKRGIVHRDIKPGNILLDEDGAARVADFGLAVHESQQASQKGSVSGTPNYMSPEQTRGAAHYVDGRSDIWSLGVVLYQLFTGKRPFQGATVQELFEEVQTRNPKPLRMIDDSLSVDLERCVLKCLEKNPADRYSCAADLARDLQESTATEAIGQVRPPPASPIAGNRPVFTKRWAVGLAVSGAVLLCLLAYQAFRPESPVSALTNTGKATDSMRPDQSTAISPDTGELELQVMIWNEQDASRQGVSITRPSVLPLRPGEEVSIQVNSAKDGFYYLVWVGSDSGVTPLFPWPLGDWTGPRRERQTTNVEIPVGTVNPTPATETVIAMWRTTPLPQEVDLADLLARFPQPNLLRTAARSKPLTRGITFSTGVGPVESEKARRFLRQALLPYFDMVRAVSFTSGDTDAAGLVQ